MLSQEIRRGFLNYFKNKGHALVPSSPVVPHDDPTLLFNNAGMNQFKDVFLGKSQRDYQAATTSQKCIRVGGKHNDLDNVGHTSRHLTFFEMLGNFSFGDYFKEKAILYAWEVTTQVFGFSPDNLWITVFEEDEEARELWRKFMPDNRIISMGEKENFWAMGDTGPCGPCSELLIDRGTKYGNARSPKEDISGERYLEFWNLVFMQFNRDSSGKMTPLPSPCIDTGAGLERVASLKIGVDSVYATDILRGLIAQVENVSGKKYNVEDLVMAPAFHVIADHIRSLSFAIADGAQPSNVERGYVLRKLLRRAVRYGRGLGLQEPFLAKILPTLVSSMGEDYPELKAAQGRIAEILTVEEEAFLRTLKKGGNILNAVIEKAQKSPMKQISGEEAFKLKDTYGFPLEEILLIAKDTSLTVNLETYQLLEEQAKEKSKSAHTVHMQQAEESLFKEYVLKHGACEFVGYTATSGEGTVMAIVVDGRFVDTLTEGQEGLVILNTTPFYAEKGGQIGDIGTLSHKRARFTVKGCQSPYTGVIVHVGRLESGVLILGEPVEAEVDAKRRSDIARHHTAAHLLHYALVKVLGAHVRQAGSLVESDRLRFDFNHHKPVSQEELRQIERLVNEKIRDNTPVKTYELSYEEAQKSADIKQFFGDKYGKTVRVIDIDYSKELCGGTHATTVGTLGFFRIIKESSIAAGVRRIEAACGKAAEDLVYQNEEIALQACMQLKTTLPSLPVKVTALQDENKELLAQIKTLKRGSLKEVAQTLATKIRKVGSVHLLAEIVDLDQEGLLLLGEELMNRHPSLLLLLAFKLPDRCQILVRISPDLVAKKMSAQELVKEICPHIKGGGGGKADSAQASGKDPLGLSKAFEVAEQYINAK
ncbi:MAG: alanine--tRNA ligase [Chlamydiales bacterium]|nr:alanine--tRNA ligase [Chlamydiales bacterium]